MKVGMKALRFQQFRIKNVLVLVILCDLFPGLVYAIDQAPTMLETGRRIYEEGVLPDGQPLIARRPEGFTLEGEYAACIGCHRRSGMGSIEGNIDNTVLVPPIAGPVLFTEARFSRVPLDPSHHYIPNSAWERALTRSAYDVPTLIKALTSGIDPDGKQLVSPMPVYDLDDVSIKALTTYLTQLGDKVAPGVDNESLHLATVITADADPDHVASILGVLNEWSRYARGSGTSWTLHVWQLEGSSEKWTNQLVDYYQNRPVFALLSGVGDAKWEPVHRFCELQRLPCILPSINVAPTIGDDWYSLYYSPGTILEAKILARYLDDDSAYQMEGEAITQFYSDQSGKTAAETLNAHLKSEKSVNTHRYRTIAPRTVMNLVNPNDTLVLWLRSEQVMQLVTEIPEPPGRDIFISSLLSPPQELNLPKPWSKQVKFVSLFDDLSLQGELAKLRLEKWLDNASLSELPYRRLQADAYAAGNLFNQALGKIRKQEIRRPPVPLTREHVIEVLENLVSKYSDSTDLIEVESHVAWYGRMSLGPRQRIAVRGGTILRYQSSDSLKLIPASERIIP